MIRAMAKVKIAVSIFICFSMIGIMIYSGYFRDEYVPAVYIPDFMTNMSWLLLLVSPFLILLSCYGCRQKSPARAKGIANVFWLITVIAFCAFVIYGYTLVKDYPLGAEEKADYVRCFKKI